VAGRKGGRKGREGVRDGKRGRNGRVESGGPYYCSFMFSLLSSLPPSFRPDAPPDGGLPV
jgi:hypothetical protein